jgi:hypothetical protein
VTVAEKARPLAALPIDPTSLVDVEPLDRGELYNEADLDFRQREAAEEALRMVLAGTYPTGAAR